MSTKIVVELKPIEEWCSENNPKFFIRLLKDDEEIDKFEKCCEEVFRDEFFREVIVRLL